MRHNIASFVVALFVLALVVSSSACTQEARQSLVSPTAVPIAEPSKSVLVVTPTSCSSGCQPSITWQASPSAASAEIRRNGQVIKTGTSGDSQDNISLLSGTYVYSLWEGVTDAKVQTKTSTVVVN